MRNIINSIKRIEWLIDKIGWLTWIKLYSSSWMNMLNF